ncbi:MAG: UDP-N-acetylmuramate--L-alanine ligase [Patescibacteria group bacterium]
MAKNSTPPIGLSAHFVGIGGIGISALARWFLAQNWAVTGSDLTDSQIIRDLIKSGIKVKIGHKTANLPKKSPNMVIYSAAVPKDNPELIEAVGRGIKPLSYPEVLGCLTKVYKTIGIAGSHGKSTTTAMIGLILRKAGLDPNVVVGTNLKEFNGTNFRYGNSKFLVLESDEWKASFLNYFPEIAVVTNIDKEHLDYYKTFGNVKKTFLKFLSNVKAGGFLVLNQNDEVLLSLQSPIKKIAGKNRLKIFWYSTKYQVSGIKCQAIKKILKIPGEHNLSNAMAALAVSKILKIPERIALKALSEFHGTWRRMEYRGTYHVSRIMYQGLNTDAKRRRIQAKGYRIRVYDDYAHHPTEIRATLSAIREKFKGNPIICVYQPHQAKRLKALFKDFVDAFYGADILVLLPVYEVAGRDKFNSSYTSQKLAVAIKKAYPQKEVYYFNNPKQIKSFIQKILPAKPSTLSPIVVMMGAGDIINYTSRLL